MDATLSLAISLTNTKGAAALLLGSGISSAAGILTGWGITLDLVQKLAATMGEKPGADPAAWYRDKFGEEPDYSKLLEGLAPTKAERQRLLRGYFEPTEEEREEGLKQPTQAHHAIAELVKKGYVRVILTTNFDQLLEKALEAAGVHPAVVSDAGAIASMMPLQHEPVTIIKLHGHYLDTRLRNTPAELATYEAELDRLLDRVFDEYGLIICGWSGVWDTALREAMLRSRGQRFSTYWAVRGALAAEAEPLAKHRQAQVIGIGGADEFFLKLAEKVAALEDLAQPLPVTTAVAVATMKRYLPVEAYRIRLHDLVAAEVEAVWEKAGSLIQKGTPTVDGSAQIVRALDHLCERIIHLLAIGSYWGGPESQPIWIKAVERLSALKDSEFNSYTNLNELRSYPLLLAFYAVGLGATAAGNTKLLLDLLLLTKFRSNDYRKELEAPAKRLFQPVSQEVMAGLWPAKRVFALNDHLHRVLQAAFLELEPDEASYDDLFDSFEYVTALTFKGVLKNLKDSNAQFVWHGRFLIRGGRTGGNTAVKEIQKEISAMGPQFPLLKRGLFNGLATELGPVVAEIDELMNKARFWQ
jgi:hypothetical protein